MNIPPFWARDSYQGEDGGGRRHRFEALGWSFNSLEEAKAQALARARRIFEAVLGGKPPQRYAYDDRPIKEEIVDAVRYGAGLVGVITRNRYGALVLNTDRVLFADVDFPKPAMPTFFGLLAMLFSSRRREEFLQGVVRRALQGVEDWATRHPERSFRLYRTCEGLRLLFTDQLYDPTAAETGALLESLDTDPMYLRLTQKQACFRARLTAKPWRCGCSRPPNGYPWTDPQAEATYRRWEASYTQTDAGYRVCEFVRAYGRPAELDAIGHIVEAHDRLTRVNFPAPLA